MADSSSIAADRTGIVRLELPADSAYLAIARTVVANLAARHDFPVDQIDDLRMAVDEAAALLLDEATGPLTAQFELGPGSIDTTLTATTPAGFEIDRDSFGWTLLAALVDDLDVRVEPAGEGTQTTLVIRAQATHLDGDEPGQVG